MFLLRCPSEIFIQERIAALRTTAFTYPNPGSTKYDQAPSGFRINQSSAVIGNGAAAFQKAIQAVKDLRMLKLGWIQPVGVRETIAENAFVCTLARQLGLYSLNIARIVYVEQESAERYGFGYGTTVDYPIDGEERFTVMLDRKTGDVRFEIFSFSRARTWLMRLGIPWIIRAQQRFCRESTAAMRLACVA